MDSNLYRREVLERNSQPLTQADLRIGLLMSILALVAVNALL